MKYIPVFSFLLLHTASLLGSHQNTNNLQNLSFEQMVERLRLNDAERLRALLLGHIPYRAQPVAPRVPSQPAAANDDAKSAPAQQSMLASFASSKK